MRISSDCLHCVLRQCVEAAAMASDDPALNLRVARDVAAALSRCSADATPPEISEVGHALTREITGCDDPYRAVKDRYNAAALAMLPRLRELVAGATDRLQTAAAIAAAGNVIDFAQAHAIDVDAALRQALEEGFAVNEWPAVKAALDRAHSLLYLADNTGEIVFDRVFLEELRRAYPDLNLTCVVKPASVLNDATEEDARRAGIHEIAALATTGQRAVGLVFERAPEELRRRLESADLIIAKGHANYEALDDLDLPAAFILKAKCPTVAAALGVKLGDVVLKAQHLDSACCHQPSQTGAQAAAQRPASVTGVGTGEGSPAGRLRAVIFDLDGVIYRGKTPLPFAAAAVTWARERGLAVRFLTNNSTVTRAEYVRRLEGFGVPTAQSEIMTSAYATALYLKSRANPGSRVLVVGEGGLREETAAAGFEVMLPPQRDGARYVVVGMDRAFNYATLHAAMMAVLDGAEFIASNADPTFPVENGLLPGGGTIVAAIETAVGFAPYLIGKPSTRMLELVLAEVGCEPAAAVMVGDRLDTDIKAGCAAGVHTALVLTGISSAADVTGAPPDMRPEWVIETLEYLPGLLEGQLAESSGPGS